MRKTSRVLTASIIIIIVSLGTWETLSANYVTSKAGPNPGAPLFQYADTNLWQYLRLGLNYLESPRPLAPPETVPPGYLHPDSRGFGAYGLTVEAYQDVQRLYPYFKQHAWQDVLNSQELYDLANQAFADWLIKNLKDYIPEGATEEEIFNVLHQAWNLGLSGFKSGKKTFSSRIKRAEEFKERWGRRENHQQLALGPSY